MLSNGKQVVWFSTGLGHGSVRAGISHPGALREGRKHSHPGALREGR